MLPDTDPSRGLRSDIRGKKGINAMRSAAHYIRRARELGPLGTLRRAWVRATGELVLRGRELWWGWMARREMTDAALLARTTGGWHSVDDLLDHLAGRPGSSFLLPHDSPEQTSQLLRQHYPQHVSVVLNIADAACRNQLTLLGRAAHYADGIDWHSEPLTGWRWPLWHRSRLNRYLWSGSRPADLILTWEMNRHQHFVALGMAYWLTGDPRYVEAFVAQVRSWIEANPLQHGINWLGGQEMSCRLIAWTLAFQFFRGSALFREQAGSAFLKSLFQQVDFLNTHLSTSKDVPNNHLIGETTALALVGTVFPEFRGAATWRETGLRLLSEQVTAQTHADGVNKEQATGYHRFVAEFLLVVIALGRRGVLPRTPIVEDVLEQMLDYILYTLTPAATAPMWGDSVNYFALRLSWGGEYWDFRPLLATGAALFGRADWKFFAGRFHEEAFWLLGPECLAAWDQLDARPPEQTSRAFADAGMYIIRDAWTEDTDVALFRCGPFGLGGERHCAHAHCDLLSLVLWIGGRPLLVDSGTYTYHGPWRDFFRLTDAHNTLMGDGNEQATPRREFNWRDVSRAQCLAWDEKRVVGCLQLAPDLVHRREVHHPHPGVWEVIDDLEGEARHQLSWFFHFAPSLSLRWSASSEHLMVEEHDSPYAIVVPPSGVHVDIRTGWYSSSYGHKEPTPLLVATWRGEIPAAGLHFSWKFKYA